MIAKLTFVLLLMTMLASRAHSDQVISLVIEQTIDVMNDEDFSIYMKLRNQLNSEIMIPGERDDNRFGFQIPNSIWIGLPCFISSESDFVIVEECIGDSDRPKINGNVSVYSRSIKDELEYLSELRNKIDLELNQRDTNWELLFSTHKDLISRQQRMIMKGTPTEKVISWYDIGLLEKIVDEGGREARIESIEYLAAPFPSEIEMSVTLPSDSFFPVLFETAKLAAASDPTSQHSEEFARKIHDYFKALLLIDPSVFVARQYFETDFDFFFQVLRIATAMDLENRLQEREIYGWSGPNTFVNPVRKYTEKCDEYSRKNPKLAEACLEAFYALSNEIDLNLMRKVDSRTILSKITQATRCGNVISFTDDQFQMITEMASSVCSDGKCRPEVVECFKLMKEETN